MKIFSIIFFAITLLVPFSAQAEDLLDDEQETAASVSSGKQCPLMMGASEQTS